MVHMIEGVFLVLRDSQKLRERLAVAVGALSKVMLLHVPG